MAKNKIKSGPVTNDKPAAVAPKDAATAVDTRAASVPAEVLTDASAGAGGEGEVKAFPAGPDSVGGAVDIAAVAPVEVPPVDLNVGLLGGGLAGGVQDLEADVSPGAGTVGVVGVTAQGITEIAGEAGVAAVSVAEAEAQAQADLAAELAAELATVESELTAIGDPNAEVVATHAELETLTNARRAAVTDFDQLLAVNADARQKAIDKRQWVLVDYDKLIKRRDSLKKKLGQ